MADLRSIDDYLARITPWQRDKPRFAATVALAVQPLVDSANLMRTMPSLFDLRTAVGAQLDVDGEWIGRSRYVPLPIDGLFFSFDDERRGFDTGFWKGPYDTGVGITRLDDDTYRALLYAKIAANHWDGTVPGAQAVYDEFFQDPRTLVFVQDGDDMTMTVGLSGHIPPPVYLAILSGGFIPLKPQAVRTYYTITSVDEAPLFGFDVDNEHISGWDTGAWGVDADYLFEHGY